MKRADIKVGEEYAVARSKDFIGRGSTRRARVVGFSDDSDYPVLVEVLDDKTGNAVARTQSLPSREVRMTWVDYLAAVAEEDRKHAGLEAEHAERVLNQLVEIREVMDVLAANGVVETTAVLTMNLGSIDRFKTPAGVAQRAALGDRIHEADGALWLTAPLADQFAPALARLCRSSYRSPYGKWLIGLELSDMRSMFGGEK